MIYKSKKLVGMPVVSLADGHQLGRVKRLLIDQQKMCIMAFTIDRKGWFKEQPVIPYSYVKNVGNHAITVDHANAVVRLSSLPELESLAKKSLPFLGVKVISEEGTILGTVNDFYFDPQDGTIRSLEIKSGPLHSPRVLENNLVITCGRDAVIVKSGAEENLHKAAGLLKGKWQVACNSVNNILGEAGHYTRKLKTAVTSRWERLPFVSKKDSAPPPDDNT